MVGRVAGVVVIVLVLAVAPASAASGKRQWKLSGSQIVLSSTGSGPVAGATAVEVGTVSAKGLGSGADVWHVSWTGPRVFTAQVQFFFAGGSVRASVQGHGTVNADNTTVSVSGSGKITGGTGAYRRARGTFTLSGSTTTTSQALTQSETGSVTY